MSGLLRALNVLTSVLAGLAGAAAWITSFSSSVTVEEPRAAVDEDVRAYEPPPGGAGDVAEASSTRRATRRRLLRRPGARSRRTALALGVAAATLVVAGGVIAFFTAGSEPGYGGASQAGALAAGSQPGAVSTDRAITVTWAQDTPAFLGGLLGDDANGAGGYLVTRYADGDDSPIAATDDCEGLRRGASDPLACSESALPTGRWQYTVTPKYYNWLGAESDRSGAAIVAPEAPLAVTLVNGGGVGAVWINQANESSVEVDVSLPATSLASDTVHLEVSDGSNDVSASLPGTAGAGTVSFTGLDLGGLDDGELTFTAWAESAYTDLSEETSAAYDKDATSPDVVVAPERAPDYNGWYNAPVTFSASSSTDATSGIESCDADVVYSAPDGSDLTVELDCTDTAGNTATGTSDPFDFDDTDPVVTAVVADRSADQNGWYNAPVTWTANGTDATSGIASCESLPYPGPDGSDLTVSRSCTDEAGNTSSGTSPSFDFDDTNPVVNVTPARDPDHNGWYNAPVTFSASSSTDATSGIASCEPDVLYSAPDGTGLTVSRTCTDVAGNNASGSSAAFKFDDTNPAVTITPARGTDHNGWYNAPVLWTPGQTDATSGPATCEAPVDYTGPDSATASVSRTCTDNAGNVGSANVSFKFDDTNPVVNVTPARAPDHNGWYNAPVVFSASSSTDATSGIASCQGTVNYTAPDGTGLTVSRNCTDNAGNTASGSSATFKFDNTNPTVALSLTAAGSASISGTQISFRGNEPVAGNRTFRIRSTVTDATSGAASTTFPAINTSGWTHNAETVTTPAGGPFDSSPYTWPVSPNTPSGYSVSFADQAGNSVSQSVTFVKDENGPTLNTLEMFDVDGNGKVDRVVATFGEPLRACTAPCTTGSTLTSPPSGGTLANVVIAGNQATFNITEGAGAADTAVGSFKVRHNKDTAGAQITDATGNPADFDSAPADKAAPAPIALEMRDNDTDGKIDRLVAVFSETIQGTNTGQWQLANVPSGGTINSVSTSSSTATVTITEGAGAHDTAVGAFTVALSASASGIRDGVGNQSSFAAQTPLDKAGPVPVSITDTDGLTNGRMESGDTLVVTFSEPIATAVAGSTVVEADPSGNPGPNDTLNIPGLTNGARPTGSDNYVTANNQSVSCSGSTLAKSNGDRTITATVGPTCTGTGNLGTNLSPTNFNFAPATTLADAAGNSAVGSLTVAIRLF